MKRKMKPRHVLKPSKKFATNYDNLENKYRFDWLGFIIIIGLIFTVCLGMYLSFVFETKKQKELCKPLEKPVVEELTKVTKECFTLNTVDHIYVKEKFPCPKTYIYKNGKLIDFKY